MNNSINRVLDRINEIKTRFGLKPPVSTQGNSFQETLKTNTAQQEKPVQPVKQKDNITVSDIKKIAGDYAAANRIPPQLVNAVIETESGFNPEAVSPKGALGLMQLMPTTVKELGISNPFNITENIMGGVSHLRKLLDKYGWDYRKALAAYNAGEGAVDREKGIPPYKETKQYIKKVIDAYLENVRTP